MKVMPRLDKGGGGGGGGGGAHAETSCTQSI